MQEQVLKGNMAVSTKANTKIAVAPGDGIGPEIMDATLRVLRAVAPELIFEMVETGEQVYLRGEKSGLDARVWDVLQETGVMLKGPITTPQGGGYKSVNVTLRKTLGLFSNVRPVRSYAPFVPTHYPNMDVVIVRENEEDLYAGIEHQQTTDVVQCLKLITRPGCERIIRYAFEYARLYGRKDVCCMTKDNIMKQTDGLFHQVFDEIAQEYPDIRSRHMIIDIGAALLAQRPETFDLVVTPNLYGDIISDIVAQVAGSVGLAGSANIGLLAAIFEAIHGSAPDIAGKNLANPSGLMQAAVLMLTHMGKASAAANLSNALLVTLEDGIHTADIFKEGFSSQLVGTREFADAVIARIGKQPRHFPSVSFPESKPIQIPEYTRKSLPRQLMGVDMFICWEGNDPEKLGKILEAQAGPGWKLKMITNRGVKVYPEGNPATFCTDHWRCRYVGLDAHTENQENPVYAPVLQQDIIGLMDRLYQTGFEVIKTENLYEIAGRRAFSLGQGE